MTKIFFFFRFTEKTKLAEVCFALETWKAKPTLAKAIPEAPQWLKSTAEQHFSASPAGVTVVDAKTNLESTQKSENMWNGSKKKLKIEHLKMMIAPKTAAKKKEMYKA